MDSIPAPRPAQPADSFASDSEARLSYKFQRLREKLRAAIDTGELSGKLPGERVLARKFRVNAKTLSKALTDLAAEGVLERSIGRGTFVRAKPGEQTSTSHNVASADRWLIICDPDQVDSAVITTLQSTNSAVQIVQSASSLRPSFLSSFKTVLDFSDSTPQALLRDLLVRNISVVLVGREPTNYSMNAVLIDRVLGASCLARDMMLAGHRRFVAVQRRGQTQICDAIRSAALRYAPDATVDIAYTSEAVGAVEMGATALICDGATSAATVRSAIENLGMTIPGQVSIAAVGTVSGAAPCSGYFVSVNQKVEAIVQMIREGNHRKPATVWLAGARVDAGTIGPIEMIAPLDRRQPHVGQSIATVASP